MNRQSNFTSPTRRHMRKWCMPIYFICAIMSYRQNISSNRQKSRWKSAGGFADKTEKPTVINIKSGSDGFDLTLKNLGREI